MEVSAVDGLLIIYSVLCPLRSSLCPLGSSEARPVLDVSSATITVSQEKLTECFTSPWRACLCFFLILFTCSQPTAVSMVFLVALTEGAALIFPSVSGADPSLQLPLNRVCEATCCFSFLALLILRKIAICSFKKSQNF